MNINILLILSSLIVPTIGSAIQPGQSGITVESINQRIEEIQQEFNNIDQAIIERDKLIQLWKESSDTLLKHHHRIIQLLQQFKTARRTVCKPIQVLINANQHHRIAVDSTYNKNILTVLTN